MAAPAALGLVPKAVTDDPYVTECWAQSEPAHKLVNLAKVPMMLLTSEAGYNTLWDPCTYRYLTQAGVFPTWIRLDNIGIHGNSHFMFIEENSDQVAGVVLRLDSDVRAKVSVPSRLFSGRRLRPAPFFVISLPVDLHVELLGDEISSPGPREEVGLTRRGRRMKTTLGKKLQP